ncbi:ubiquinol-cytochrome C reductase core subunit 2 [Rhizoctonia solani]|uniref:Cytochrome b-c1 complex subunit 2, mitochondrial n=1 Tax=Rhizoctonia solani TaxID=456999 RepID=A0A8H8T386_9AGAM|nr:ubiquinol-cytochrome C reductase core subunit 2 [Rhizoctonia solani]QRW26353.1 ubiquinol-cytochrome C reductase core subunit 2 [Rhizoctonia solani]
MMLARAGRSTAALKRSFATTVDAAGVSVAAVDHGQPTTAVTVLVKAGSRYETQQELPICSRTLRSRQVTTSQRSALRTVREAELYGGVLSSTLTREHLAITAEFLRGDELSFIARPHFVDLLSSVVTSTQFLPHEFAEDVVPHSIAETTAALANPSAQALELAHTIAFRSTGLGASLFAQHPSKNDLEALKEFAKSAFTKSNVAVIGTGIDSSKLSELVSKHLSGLPSFAGAGTKGSSSQYFGGETGLGRRVGTRCLSALVLLLGHLNYRPSNPISTALPRIYPILDAALFGVLVSGNNVAADTKTAVAALKKGLSKEEATKAVSKAKFKAASALEAREGLVAAVAPQVFGGSTSSLDSFHAALDKVSEASVSKTLSSLLGAKPTFVAIGDVMRFHMLMSSASELLETGSKNLRGVFEDVTSDTHRSVFATKTHHTTLTAGWHYMPRIQL